MIKGQIGKYCFAYQLEGDPSQPAMLFLHGFMGDRQEFDQQIRALSPYFYCIAIDLPAHGDSYLLSELLIGSHSISNHESQRSHGQGESAPILLEPCYTMPAIAHLLIEFLELLSIQRCTLVGYSMGGRIALYLAINFPQYFDRLILESTSAGLTTPSARGDRLVQDLLIASKLAAATPTQFQEFLDDWYRQPIFANLRLHPHFTDLGDRRFKQKPLALAKCLYTLSVARQRSLWQDLPTLKIPVLLITGDLDLKFVQVHQQMARLLPFAHLAFAPRCGHNVHFEQPQTFTAIVQNFVFLQNKVC
ncbi:alpha/beta fold hydrolase [Pseudanabaena cinerea]|jgi:2-succinyl-6-hydroxy-2,4-cyclohexadiene-1-carboxylate synthase|uniref:alpha/beta fold hydrolase n=1 Tax=Pseudanabaena cinerea TaxID=2661616 RepID=UPI0018EF841F|nr:alpha/beta fold hydrolase [Pseudanabaena cinerea]